MENKQKAVLWDVFNYTPTGRFRGVSFYETKFSAHCALLAKYGNVRGPIYAQPVCCTQTVDGIWIKEMYMPKEQIR